MLQHLLNGQADPPTPRLVPDSIFGPKTQSAVVALQKQKKLAPDGIVGPKTKGELLPGRAFV